MDALGEVLTDAISDTGSIPVISTKKSRKFMTNHNTCGILYSIHNLQI